MRKNLQLIAINRATWIIASAVALIAHIAWMIHSHNAADFARCGALWAIFAGALIARPVIRLGFAEFLRQSQELDGGGYGDPAVEARQTEAAEQTKADLFNVQVLGPSLLIAGTLLWGYGDVLVSWLMPSLFAPQ